MSQSVSSFTFYKFSSDLMFKVSRGFRRHCLGVVWGVGVWFRELGMEGERLVFRGLGGSFNVSPVSTFHKLLTDFQFPSFSSKAMGSVWMWISM